MDEMTYRSPVYLQMREIIRGKIEEGEYPPCTAIPSEAELAECYGINRQTVHNAVDTLVNEGLLRRVPGKGIFVLGKKVDRDLDELQGFTQTMLDKNVAPSVRVLTKALRRAGELYRDMFGISAEDDVYYIKRLCCADAEPVSLEEIYIPRYLVPKMEGIDLSVFSVYEIYEFYRIRLERAEQTLELVRLEPSDARLLGIDAQLPVMLFECVTYDDRGRIIEFNRNYVRGDKCNFTVHFNNDKPAKRSRSNGML